MSNNAQKKITRYTADDDICLLTLILKINPYRNSEGWNEIATELLDAGKKEVSSRNARDHTNKLLKHLNEDKLHLLKRSSSDEEYAKKYHLLKQVAELKRLTKNEQGHSSLTETKPPEILHTETLNNAMFFKPQSVDIKPESVNIKLESVDIKLETVNINPQTVNIKSETDFKNVPQFLETETIDLSSEDDDVKPKVTNIEPPALSAAAGPSTSAYSTGGHVEACKDQEQDSKIILKIKPIRKGKPSKRPRVKNSKNIKKKSDLNDDELEKEAKRVKIEEDKLRIKKHYELEQKEIQLKADEENLKKEKAILEQEKIDLKKKTEDLQKEKDDLKNQKAALEKEKSSLEKQKAALNDRESKFKSENKSLKKRESILEKRESEINERERKVKLKEDLAQHVKEAVNKFTDLFKNV